jgi:glycosyltransferase involved in cell wall biosynthesis
MYGKNCVMNDQPDPMTTTEASDQLVRDSRPLVSVVMTTYNHQPYLAEAIEGVAAQEVDFPIELLIGEDCSTDGTRQVALDYQKKYADRIRVILHESNVGGIENDRRLMSKSRGRYVAFCEGDDYWTDSKKLASQVEILERFRDVNLCYHSAVRKTVSGETLRIMGKLLDGDGLVPAEEFFARHTKCPTASAVIRREAVSIPCFFYDTAPVGDYFRDCLFSMGAGAYYIDRPMSVYRVGVPGSWSVRNANLASDPPHMEAYVAAWDASLSALDDHTEHHYRSAIEERRQQIFFRALIGFIKFGHYGDAARMLGRFSPNAVVRSRAHYVFSRLR